MLKKRNKEKIYTSNFLFLSRIFTFSFSILNKIQNFRNLISNIIKNEKSILEERKKIQKFNKLLPTFVENLDKHQFFQSLFENDTDGDILRMIDTITVEELNQQYQNDLFQLTQKIYNIGLIKYEQRLNEIQKYEKFIENCLEEVAKPSRRYRILFN